MYFYVYEADPESGKEIWRSVVCFQTYQDAKEARDNLAKDEPSCTFEVNHEWN